MKTRKQKHVEHHHFLVRMETTTCPLESDKKATVEMIRRILKEIRMEPLDEPRVYYQKTPKWNEGLTGIVPITTSHLAFHFWRYPQKQILHNPLSNCLLEFDVYTCGSLSKQQLKKVLQNLTPFEPTHLDATVLNRKHALSIESRMEWDSSDSSWDLFCGKM